MTKPFLRKSACGKTTLKQRAEKWAHNRCNQVDWSLAQIDLVDAFMAGFRAGKKEGYKAGLWEGYKNHELYQGR